MTKSAGRILLAAMILLFAMVGAGVSGQAQTPERQDLKMLGEQTVDQVRATAFLQEAASGQGGSHRLQVKFITVENGGTIVPGRVTLTTIDPDHETTMLPVTMQPRQDHFEASIDLKEPGQYLFRVQAVLDDGRSRQFDFAYALP